MDLLRFPVSGATVSSTPNSLARCPPDALLPSPKPGVVSFSKATTKPSPRFGIRARVPLSLCASVSSPQANEKAPLNPPPRTRWMVVMEKPAGVGSSRAEVIDYYVSALARVLGSEKEAQMCIYDASWENQYGFCCDIDEEWSRELANFPGVMCVRPDTDEFGKKNYNYSDHLPVAHVQPDGDALESPSPVRNNDFWLVRMEKPGVEVVTKAQMVDYYAQSLTKVLGNEKDAQVCIYHISWEKNFGFCCIIDEECARELADVPGVLSVRPDTTFGSENKDYKGDLADSSETNERSTVRTKRLFVTGLSFYTSEKTLRAAFEGFGELVEVKIIIDKISKRSKGYAFIEYTTEEAAAAALTEMNGKIINGWMIVVDVARTNPPKYGRARPQSPSSSVS